MILGAGQDLILGADVGPFEIGESIEVTCEVAGGKENTYIEIRIIIKLDYIIVFDLSRGKQYCKFNLH